MSDAPDEPEEDQPGPEEGAEDGSDAPLRGWIDPDDRLWRHPSEVAASGGEPPLLLNAPPTHPYRSAIMLLVGVGAVMAVAAWVAVLLSPASQRPIKGAGLTSDTVAGPPWTTLAGPKNAVPAEAQAAARSTVQLQATTAHGTVVLIGVAVAEGVSSPRRPIS